MLSALPSHQARSLKRFSVPFLFFSLLLLPSLSFAQGAHRLSQVIIKGNGVSANVSPGSKILVCVLNTGCATAANIYLDSGLTTPAFNPITADGSGNYDYYLSSGCVDEQISAPGQGTIFLPHVCPSNGQTGSGSPPAPPQYAVQFAGPSATAFNADSTFNFNPTTHALQAYLTNGNFNSDAAATGSGNNGIANLLAGPCAGGGCTIFRPANSTSTETFTTTPNLTHIRNSQAGQQADWFHTSATAKTENYTSDQDGTSSATNRPVGILRNFSFSGKGYSQGNQWTVGKAIADIYNFYQRGIEQNWGSNCYAYSIGDKACGLGYHYVNADAGATGGSDEGIGPDNVALAQNNNWYHGTASSGAATGSVLLSTTYNSSIGTQNRNQGSDGGYAIDITQGTVTGTVTGFPTAIYGGAGPSSLPVTSAVASTACGTIETAIPEPANPLTPESITINVDISKCGGPFTAGGVAQLSGGYFIEQVPITAVGPPPSTGSIQSVTITHRYPNPVGNSLLAQGGTHGYISFDKDIATNGFRTVFPIAGALDSTHLIMGFQLLGGNSGSLSGIYIAPVTMDTLTSTGTTLSGATYGASNYSLNRVASMVVANCPNTAFNGTAVNLVASDNASNPSAPIYTWTQTVAAGTSAHGCTLSYPSSQFGYHVYPGAEQIAPMTATNQLPLEPNDTPWTTGDAIEVPQAPAYHGMTQKRNTSLQNLHVYASAGKYNQFDGDGISGDFTVDTDQINTPCSVYLGCGGTLASAPFKRMNGVSSGLINAQYFPINGNPAFTIGCLPTSLGGCSNTSRQALFSLQGGAIWWYPSNGALAAPVLNAFSGFQINGAAPSGHCLLGNGANYVDTASCGGVVASLATTGTSGAATLTSGVLNIPTPTNASALSSGTVADARLSANIPLLNGGNTFTALNNFTNSGGLQIVATSTATSSTNYSSPPLLLTGSGWNGSVGGPITWQLTNVVGAGTNPTSTLTFAHGATPAAVSVPALQTNVYTVSSLPVASSLPAGSLVTVSDDTGLPTSNTCTGGGSQYAIAITNGTSWTCH